MQLPAKEKLRLKNNYGDWAIVTGASSGIGLELARLLADAGFNLILNARNGERLLAVKKQLLLNKIQIETIAADISDPAGVDKIIQASTGKKIGLLINNAGFGTSGLFANSSVHAEISLLRLNCVAVLSLTHYFIQLFRQQKRGGIIFLSSLVAFQGVPYAANYAASKAYVQSLAEALAIELKPDGIDILCAVPGPVETGFGQRANMKMNGAISPARLGVPMLKALGKKSQVIPGMFSKLLVYALRTVPRFAKTRIMKKVMGGFTRHQRA